MALTTTTLSAAITLNDLTIPLTAVTSVVVGHVMRIDDEFIGAVLAINGTTTVTVRGRGWDGTSAAPHRILSLVTFGPVGDFPPVSEGKYVNQPPEEEGFITLGADVTISDAAGTVPPKDTTFIIDKATAAAITLAAPSKGADGLRLTFMSATAAAHVITYTAGFNGNTTSSDLATFAATAGNSLTVQAFKGLWGVIAATGVTIA